MITPTKLGEGCEKYISPCSYWHALLGFRIIWHPKCLTQTQKCQTLLDITFQTANLLQYGLLDLVGHQFTCKLTLWLNWISPSSTAPLWHAVLFLKCIGQTTTPVRTHPFLGTKFCLISYHTFIDSHHTMMENSPPSCCANLDWISIAGTHFSETHLHCQTSGSTGALPMIDNVLCPQTLLLVNWPCCTLTTFLNQSGTLKSWGW